MRLKPSRTLLEVIPGDSQFDRSSLMVLVSALVILLLSLAQTLYRLSLPSDGWSFLRDTTGAGHLLIFDRNLSGLPSPLRLGDHLVGIEGKPYEEILADALASIPQRPANWEVGQPVQYNIVRDGVPINVRVRLHQLTAAQALANLGRNLFLDPGPLLTLGVAFFVFLRHPRIPAARLLLLFGSVVFASNSVSQVVSGTNLIGPAELFYIGAFWPAQFYNSLVWPLLIAPMFLHLLLSFPIENPPYKRFPGATMGLLYGLMPAMTATFALSFIGRPLDFWRAWSGLSFADFVVVLVLSIAAMIYILATERTGDSRLQVRWVAWGALITSLGSLAGSLLIAVGMVREGQPAGWIVTRLLTLGFPVSLAIAILRYRLFEIDVIINRTLVYGTLTALLALVYFGSVVLLQQVFRSFMGQTSTLAVVLSTLLIAGLFTPLRSLLQAFIDRQFFRQKYNTSLALEAFSATTRNEVELDALTQRLVEIVNQTLQPKAVSFWVNAHKKGQQK